MDVYRVLPGLRNFPFPLINPVSGIKTARKPSVRAVYPFRIFEPLSQIAVVLGYYNGSVNLPAQIYSIFDQTVPVAKLIVSDDASRPEHTLDLKQIPCSVEERTRIKLFRRTHNVGFVKNFFSALALAGPEYLFYAFSDHDDIWYPDKLERALAALADAYRKISLPCIAPVLS